jgi:hypothetical protein
MLKGDGITFPDRLTCEFHVKLLVRVTAIEAHTTALTEDDSTMNEKTPNTKESSIKFTVKTRYR